MRELGGEMLVETKCFSASGEHLSLSIPQLGAATSRFLAQGTYNNLVELALIVLLSGLFSLLRTFQEIFLLGGAAPLLSVACAAWCTASTCANDQSWPSA